MIRPPSPPAGVVKAALILLATGVILYAQFAR